jgi:hypothetical protein
MRDKRRITDETMDQFTEWIFCHWPCALEEKEFIRGIFFICDEAIGDAITEERRRLFHLAWPSAN